MMMTMMIFYVFRLTGHQFGLLRVHADGKEETKQGNRPKHVSLLLCSHRRTPSSKSPHFSRDPTETDHSYNCPYGRRTTSHSCGISTCSDSRFIRLSICPLAHGSVLGEYRSHQSGADITLREVFTFASRGIRPRCHLIRMGGWEGRGGEGRGVGREGQHNAKNDERGVAKIKDRCDACDVLHYLR